MTYRAPLLDQSGQLGDHYKVMTYSQLAKFAQWSIETSKPVLELMQGWIIELDESESFHQGTDVVFLTGELPSGLYGGMDHEGRTHT